EVGHPVYGSSPQRSTGAQEWLDAVHRLGAGVEPFVILLTSLLKCPAVADGAYSQRPAIRQLRVPQLRCPALSRPLPLDDVLDLVVQLFVKRVVGDPRFDT